MFFVSSFLASSALFALPTERARFRSAVTARTMTSSQWVVGEDPPSTHTTSRLAGFPFGQTTVSHAEGCAGSACLVGRAQPRPFLETESPELLSMWPAGTRLIRVLAAGGSPCVRTGSCLADSVSVRACAVPRMVCTNYTPHTTISLPSSRHGGKDTRTVAGHLGLPCEAVERKVPVCSSALDSNTIRSRRS